MRKVTLSVAGFLALFIAIPMSAFAQEGYRITSLTISSGENTTSSGLTGVIRFTNEKESRLLEVAVQQEQAWVLYGPTFKLGQVDGVVAGSIGHHQGAPWAGPFLSLSMPVAKNVAVSMFQWPGIYGWEPKDWKTENDHIQNPESILLGYIGSAQLDMGPVSLIYSWQNFLDESWNQLPGVAYTAKIRDDISASGSVTWNSSAEKCMFYIGATWKPKKK